MYPPLLSLSPELVFSIYDKLSLTDLKQLRLSCKTIGRIADSLVLRKLRISVEKASLDESISYLHSFARSPVRYIAQDILIDDLSSLSPSSPGTSDLADNGEPSSMPRNKKKIRELIMDALASLTAIQGVSWHPNRKDCWWIQETIWDVIKTFSTLRYLHIDAKFLQLTPTFNAFTTLESISIDASACSEISWLYTSLSKLYASCSTLTSLAISDRSDYRVLTMENSVDRIFLGCPKNILPPLRRLYLHDCFVRINKFTLPHLRQLTSLELICRQHGDLDWGLDCDYGHPRDIWSTFTGSGIQLEELVHNTTNTSLLDYLSSYSGLKKLELSVSPSTNASSSDETATRFFSDVLPRHLVTLESLNLDAYFEGEWCFTSRNAGLIGQCTKLNHLLMSIISFRQEAAADGFDVGVVANPDGNMVKHLLDTVMQHPLMNHLSLTAAFPESQRNSRCGTGLMRHYHWSEEDIKMKVKNYRPPLSCSYLLEVEVAGNMFEGVRDAADGQLRYVGVVSNLKKRTRKY